MHTQYSMSLYRYYQSFLSQDEQLVLDSSLLAKDGIQLIDSPTLDPVDTWDNFVSESDERNRMQDILQNDGQLDNFLDDWLSVVNSPEMVEMQGCKVVLYNALTDVLVPDEDRLSVSGKWHYDNYTPQSFIRYIIYLNDSSEHGGGIDVATASSSSIFSNKTGYIGLPLDRRLSDISLLEQIDTSLDIHNIRPNRGQILVFNPTKCMHRGINPTLSNRKSIFLCAFPVSKEMSNHAIKHLSKNLILSQKPGCDIIPLFRTKVSEHEERGSFVDLTHIAFELSFKSYFLSMWNSRRFLCIYLA